MDWGAINKMKNQWKGCTALIREIRVFLAWNLTVHIMISECALKMPFVVRD